MDAQSQIQELLSQIEEQFLMPATQLALAAEGEVVTVSERLQ
jgi:hypothetical protein